jgi:hypothetical protein
MFKTNALCAGLLTPHSARPQASAKLMETFGQVNRRGRETRAERLRMNRRGRETGAERPRISDSEFHNS